MPRRRRPFNAAVPRVGTRAGICVPREQTSRKRKQALEVGGHQFRCTMDEAGNRLGIESDDRSGHRDGTDRTHRSGQDGVSDICSKSLLKDGARNHGPSRERHHRRRSESSRPRTVANEGSVPTLGTNQRIGHSGAIGRLRSLSQVRGLATQYQLLEAGSCRHRMGRATGCLT